MEPSRFTFALARVGVTPLCLLLCGLSGIPWLLGRALILSLIVVAHRVGEKDRIPIIFFRSLLGSIRRW